MAVSVRGRYIPKEQQNVEANGERPLYLYIQSRSAQCIEDAVRKIEALLNAPQFGFEQREVMLTKKHLR